MVEWHIGGASWKQNANAGNDSGNWGRTQQQRVNSMFEKIIALPRKLRAIRLVPMITPSACACSQELEQFHNHQGFTNIRVKGLVTQLTTMMNGDGGYRCKGR